eukprot:TRINITY_DN1914_c0_g1_i1.p1 TRINITY_DN1914_c0_g1~~TRINITY_DN1914_c0_g1_i1.p1  ORF type:complete len:1797 (-),score=243.90 TRINITY_DN1914_c0_g1_i1:39-5429(-)
MSNFDELDMNDDDMVKLMAELKEEDSKDSSLIDESESSKDDDGDIRPEELDDAMVDAKNMLKRKCSDWMLDDDKKDGLLRTLDSLWDKWSYEKKELMESVVELRDLYGKLEIDIDDLNYSSNMKDEQIEGLRKEKEDALSLRDKALRQWKRQKEVAEKLKNRRDNRKVDNRNGVAKSDQGLNMDRDRKVSLDRIVVSKLVVEGDSNVRAWINELEFTLLRKSFLKYRRENMMIGKSTLELVRTFISITSGAILDDTYDDENEALTLTNHKTFNAWFVNLSAYWLDNESRTFHSLQERDNAELVQRLVQNSSRFIPDEFIRHLKKTTCRNLRELRLMMSNWFEEKPSYFQSEESKTNTKIKKSIARRKVPQEDINTTEIYKRWTEGEWRSVPRDVRNKRKDAGACYRCGELGHFTSECEAPEIKLGAIQLRYEKKELSESSANKVTSKNEFLKLGSIHLEDDFKKNRFRVVEENPIICTEFMEWTMEGKISDLTVVAYFDSGASHNFMTARMAVCLGLVVDADSSVIQVADNMSSTVTGRVKTETSWGDISLELSFYILEDVPGNFNILLGRDFENKLGTDITMKRDEWIMTRDEEIFKIPMLNKGKYILAAEDTLIKKGAQPIKVWSWGDSGIVSSLSDANISLIDIDELAEGELQYLWVRNDSVAPIQILKNTPIANFFPCMVEEIDTEDVMNDDIAFDDMLTGFIRKTDWEDLDSVVEEMCSEANLSKKMLQKLKALLLQKFKSLKEVLRLDEEYPDIGAKHNIETGDAKPFKSRMYTVPKHLREELKAQIMDFLRRGLIEHSNSPYSSPIVLIKKSNGSWRFCCDFRKLNNATVGDAYPIPKIEDIMSMLKGAEYFSSLDFKTGFYHLRIAEEDREKTAFSSPFGFFQWIAMPMGLKNAPASFQRAMEAIFASFLYTYVLIYIDDIIIFSKSFDDHLLHIGNVLDVIIEKKLVLNFSKCRFATSTIKYLGHVVSRGFIGPNPEKVSTITSYDVPDSKSKLKNFLGVLNYFRKFIPEYATRSRHLYDATRHDCKFKWTAEMTEEFMDLKAAMANEPILALPDLDERFFVETDWSKYGVGGILYQYENDMKRPIEYFSKKMKNAELNYSAYAGECYAILLALRKWRSYLLGKEFTLRTDHKTLQWMLFMSLDGSKYNRWIVELSSFDFIIEHIDGKMNIFSDAFSRSFAENDKIDDGFKAITFEEFVDRHNLSDYKKKKINNITLGAIGVVDKVMNRLDSQMSMFELEEIRKEQNLDDFANKMISSLESELTNNERTSGLIKSDGILYSLWTPKNGRGKVFVRPYLPATHRTKAFKLFHENAWMGGHLAADRTYDKMRRRVWWPNMYKDVTLWCKACYTCQIFNSTKLNSGPMTAIDAIEKMDLIACDIAGPLNETERGNRYIVVFSDYVSKFAWAYPVKNITAEIIAELFIHNIVLIFGAPKKFLSDQGAQFASDVVNAIFVLLDVTHVRTTAYRPQADGQVERFNRTLKSMLKKYALEGNDWDGYIDYVVCAYNTGLHSATQETPYFLMFGSEYNTPLDMIFKKSLTSLPDVIKVEKRNRKNMAKRLKKGLSAAKDAKLKYQETMKNWYDARFKDTDFKIGDKVLMLIETPVALGPKFKGPYEIIKLKGNVAYLKNNDGVNLTKGYNIDKLRLVAPETKIPSTRDSNDDTNSISDGNSNDNISEGDSDDEVSLIDSEDYDDEAEDFVLGKDFSMEDIPGYTKSRFWKAADEYKARKLVGRRFKAFLSKERGWKTGTVKDWNSFSKSHSLEYEDGTKALDNMVKTRIPVKWKSA